MVGGQGVRLPLGVDRDQSVLDRAALGALRRVVGPGIAATAGRRVRSGPEPARSLLLVAVLVILVEVVFVVIVAVVVGVSGSAVGLVDLVVPQLAIGAILGKQLGVRAALDRPAP